MLHSRLQILILQGSRATELSAPVRELAILAVATYHNCELERWVHESIARKVGFPDDQIAAL